MANSKQSNAKKGVEPRVFRVVASMTMDEKRAEAQELDTRVFGKDAPDDAKPIKGYNPAELQRFKLLLSSGAYKEAPDKTSETGPTQTDEILQDANEQVESSDDSPGVNVHKAAEPPLLSREELEQKAKLKDQRGPAPVNPLPWDLQQKADREARLARKARQHERA